MTKCDCYANGIRHKCTEPDLSGNSYVRLYEYSYCTGTKEQDPCSCGGDRSKCDFYPDVRDITKCEVECNDTEIDLSSFKRIVNSLPDDGKILIRVTKHYDDRTRKSNEDLNGYLKMGKVLVLECDTLV